MHVSISFGECLFVFNFQLSFKIDTLIQLKFKFEGQNWKA